MKYIKKLSIVFLTLVLFTFTLQINASSKVQLEINGQKITYANGEKVMVNSQIIDKGTDFRAVWVSPATNDITGYSSISSYKSQIYEVLDKMDYYNLNVMIFHVRIMNDAIYQSKYNKWSSYYHTSPDWDALPWVIEECHKRGIELHAWMNPYRVTNNVSYSVEEISKWFPTSNAAANSENLLKGSSTVILNPGKPAVQSFLVKTCMELVENYDVDAIHFDDYFYAKGIDDSSTHNLTNSYDIANWRREQVNTFIRNLHLELDKFNKANNRCVQLGISPSGVYRNGNGVVTYDENNRPISNGSATRGFAHYDDYLYADTLKWINEEWIDYILPQSYHAITLYASPYCDLIGWWDKVVKYSNVNLISAIGYYMNGNGGGSWSTNDKEAYHQALFANSCENVKGVSIYNYSAYAGSTSSNSGLSYLKDAWSKPAILPKIRTGNQLTVDKVTNLTVTQTTKGNKISFDINDDAKFYCIYKSEKPITFASSELLDIIGDLSVDGVNAYIDKNVEKGKTYYYGVKAQSYSLALSEGEVATVSGSSEELNLGAIPGLSVTDNLNPNETITVFFNELLYPFGSDINYSITYSINDEKEITSNNFEIIRNRYNYNITLPKDAKKIVITVTGENNLGKSVNVITKEVGTGLPKITNFGYVALASSDENYFVFNALNVSNQEEISYIIQFSSDTYTWNDLTEVKNLTNEKNVRVKHTKEFGNKYYRVLAKQNSLTSISDVISVNASQYLGDFNNLIINGKKPTEEYLIEEYSNLTISWSKHDKDTTYIVYGSSDNINYVNIKSFASDMEVTNQTNKITYDLTMSDISYVVYIKVCAYKGEYKAETDVIEVKIAKTFIIHDELSQHINTVLTNSYGELFK